MKALALHGSAAVLALAAATPARAADGTSVAGTSETEATMEDGREAIVVTARRREENSQDVPVAISVLDAGTLERTGNFTVNQIQQLVPSLQVASFNPRNT